MSNSESEAIAYLRSPAAIRERCDRLFLLGCEDKLRYFRVDLTQLEKCADYVIGVMRDDYPDLDIPFHSRWRHFEVGNVPRLLELEQALTRLTGLEKAKVKFDLAIVSVLLDAGAGTHWEYCEPGTGQVFRRSEGLAVASFRMFFQGAFSSHSKSPLQVDADGLLQLTEDALAQGFQVSEKNPLVGVEGRVQLLQRLGQVLAQNSKFFGTESPRLGNLVNYLWDSSNHGQLAASKVLSAVLEGLGEIWSGRLAIAGVNLGDVWIHSALQGDKKSDNYVPFHKLSQWLTYSLLEPLQELDLKITGLEELTGLPEYRNGGLCLDTGLLQVKDSAVLQERHPVGSEVIVEWRALTVSLLDKIAATIRQKLNMTADELPLVKVLQGGTWSAGRKIATQLREGGVPPIEIASDGTVF
ncbi:URC4/urg3 family protein [Coleofasciculus sp. FACHB-SPT36]|uniref:URC4/urg3 family protein n=1 Tax=Cyanophyceae TaxID=3028117 RepID=UPI00168C0F10|nr:URC4/urg3 family protein [Coleofasciculus sp. FACHB-SPT36]MBD2539223.1 URC4/urg3 family protein [Coleofasciculus sp. FACHB-SPT36]